MFFESNWSIGKKIFWVKETDKMDFPLHIHSSFEMISQMIGCTQVEVDDKVYTLTAGKSILIFPFQKHSYKSIKKGRLQLCMFSSDLIEEPYVLRKLPKDNEFDFVFLSSEKMINFYQKKAYIYSILGSFDQNREYIFDPKINTNAITKVLMFVEENFCKKCTLKDVSCFLCYDYAYLSKLFKSKIKMPFNKYVNLLRINKSKKMLETTAKSVTEIALECGYSSLRSFNRTFLAQEKITPTKYKKNK